MWSIGLCNHAHQYLCGAAGPSSSLLYFSPRGDVGGEGVLLNRLMLLFSAQYHTLCITSVTGGLLRSGHWSRSQRNENGKKWKKRSSMDSLFPFHQRALMFTASVCRTGERGPFISIIPALTYIYIHIYISHIYIYIYTPCCFVLKEERQFCKTCTCGGLIAIVLFSFLCPL